MKKYTSKKMIRNVRKLYKEILSNASSVSVPVYREITQNSYLIRSCCLNIISVTKDFSECSLGEHGEPMILEEIRDFCELSDYSFSESSLTSFFKKLSQRKNLSYAEISCLIPTAEYCCLIRLNSSLEKRSFSKEILGSLHVLNAYDCTFNAEEFSKAEDVLKCDAIYPILEASSKNLYRMQLRKRAKKRGKSERETAVELLKEARKSSEVTKKQIGAELLRQRYCKSYFFVLAFLIVFGVIAFFIFAKSIGLLVLSLVPIAISSKLLCDTFYSRVVKAQMLPKIKITEENCPVSLVTVVSIVKNREDAEKLLHRLDVLSHRIRISSIRIGLLLDFPSSNVELSSEEKELLSFLEKEISARNQRENRFFCAVRKRKWVSDEYHYEAYGRKQGAMMEFCSLLAGNCDNFSVYVGNFSEAKYFVSLDADTEPTPGSVEGLIGFMEHPNHQPVLTRQENGYYRVSKGYGAAAPRIEANPETSYRTPYSSLLAGNSGTELYNNPHFNLYQDLFSEGIFCGKGIFHISLYQSLITQRFYSDPLLSHDLPEGEILRCANITDLVFFDEIPETVPADEKRTHRWIRGDFQNAVFLSVKENDSDLFRFKIAHNLLRALFPAFCFSQICLSPILGTTALISGLFWLIFPFFLRIPSFLSTAYGPIRKYHPYREFFDGFLEILLNVLFLPTRTVNGIDGAIRGVVRQRFGRKKLEWTTAANSALNGNEISDYFYGLRWQQLGFLLVFFPQTALFGALWIIAPVIARQISQPYEKASANTAELREELKSMWKYYEELMDEKSHWLPPDNFQQEPLNIAAYRTSPTNIGLALLSILGAYDLNFISEDELYDRLEHSVDTLESLPKWKGHLYNWYDIQTLKVLSPVYVSTVDCGNYAASMFTLSKGLKALYSLRAEALALRIDKLLDATDFSLLYDSRKKLFPIGYHVEEEQFSSSYYDLYASEARLTSFYAIMKHQIPPEHWSRLARPTGSEKGDLVLSSWSGTMFEYFMPHIFLPAYRRTLSGEALRGIHSAQRRFTEKRIPWGISESGYYRFDSMLNYQYRAFGIPAAALRRDLSFSQVISPYSTFLVYPWFPVSAEKNKKHFPKGKYGYYEAVDYRAGWENPRVVQSFMAHHVGMSFLSGVNVIKNKIMQKRFMFGEGEAYTGLLTESIPAYSKGYFPNQTPEEERWQRNEERIDRPDPEHPRVRLLTNGKLSEIITDSGSGVMIKDRADLTKYSSNPDSPQGIFLFVKNKGILHGTAYAPLYQEHDYRVFFDGSGTSCYGTFREFETRLTVTMSSDEAVVARELTIKNNQLTESAFEFILCAEPVLCGRKEYSAHPEYKDLFLTAEYDPSERIVSFCRKETETWFSVTSSEPFRFDVCRDSFRDYETVDECRCDGIRKYPIFPALILRGNLEIRGRGTKSVRFFFSAGKTKEESVEALRKVRVQNFEGIQRRYAQFFESVCRSADIRSADRLIFDKVAPHVLVSSAKSANQEKSGNTLPKSTLWKYGISGDYPIVSVRIGKDGVSRVLPFIKTLFLMIYAGISVDLVILYREEEGYLTPLKTALDSLLSEVEDNVRCHVFSLNIKTVDEYLMIQKCSRLFLNLERGWKIKTVNRTFRPIRREGTPVITEKMQLQLGRGGYGKNGAYLLPKSEKELYRPFAFILSNQRIGTVLNERNLGYTFSRNASENRITPRIPGVGYARSRERYYAVIRGKRYDLLENSSVEFQKEKVIYRLDLFGYQIKTEVSILKDFPAKIIAVSVVSEESAFPDIYYEPKIILGKEDTDTVVRYTEDGKIFFNNAYHDAYGNGHAVLFAIGGNAAGNLLHFRPTKEQTNAFFVLAYGAGQRSAGQIARLLSESGRVQRELKKTSNPRILKIETPDKEFNAFCNGFLIHQIKASRILGRTGPSQPGGAYGFRDQLQDSLCLATLQPYYLKRQIIRCSAHQFEEGDVLHWWHPGSGGKSNGIRTRFSDDPFWLAYACGEYYKLTEDEIFFQRKIPYLKGVPLSDSEQDRYFTPELSEMRESIYRHVLRAIRYGLKFGQHGLILFGSGDWNDGMNRVENGGETVWGTMFAVLCIDMILPLAKQIGTSEEVDELTNSATQLRGALNCAYSDGRYLRGFRSDGVPFGGGNCMDLIPQAFSVFCNLEKEKNDSALSQAYKKLWNPQLRLIALLTPPYEPQKDGFPGSIADYPPGVRENGGQYTHAGIWFARALFRAGETEKGWEILSSINPVTHSDTAAKMRRYGAEPYVLAADVYTLPDREGMAGWTHYTGSAGWYLKTVLEDLFGICRKGKHVFIKPNLPNDWNGCNLDLTIESDVLSLRVLRGTDVGMFEENQKIPYIELNGTVHKISVIV